MMAGTDVRGVYEHFERVLGQSTMYTHFARVAIQSIVTQKRTDRFTKKTQKHTELTYRNMYVECTFMSFSTTFINPENS